MNKANFNGHCSCLFMLPWQWHVYQFTCEKTEVCVINLLAAIFGDQRIEGFKEKGEWHTGTKACVQAGTLYLNGGPQICEGCPVGQRMSFYC